MEVTATCKHCQNLYLPHLSGYQFCCTGCEGAYTFIQSVNVTDFYQKLGGQRLVPPTKIPSSHRNLDLREFKKNLVSLGNGLVRVDLVVNGFNCAACVWLFEKIPLIFEKVKKVQANPSRHRITLIVDESINPNELSEVFEKLGYEVRLPNDSTEIEMVQEKRKWFTQIAIAVASAIATMHTSLSLYAMLLEGQNSAQIFRFFSWVSLALATPTVLYSAQSFYQNALRSLAHRKLSIDLLVVFSIFLGMSVSIFNTIAEKNEVYYDAVTMLVAALLIGRMLVYFSERQLMGRSWSSAWDPTKKYEFLKEQSRIFVASGDVFPCDGKVISGSSEMNAAWITGEERLSRLSPGSLVWAGATNIGDQIEVEATEVGENSRIGQIIKKLVSIKKSRFVVFSEKLETAFLIGIFAFILFVGIYDFVYFQFSFQRIISLLMITCPCALGLAVPSILVAAMNQAFKRGIFIKDGEVFERINEVTTVVFDKTGTLTNSHLGLMSEIWCSDALLKRGVAQRELESVLGAAFLRSNHPVIRCLRERFSSKDNLPFYCRENLGQGLEILWEDHNIRVGKKGFALKPAEESRASTTELFLSIDGELSATFTFDSKLREGAREAVQALSAEKEIFLLSGDTRNAVEKVALDLRIPLNRAFYEYTPERKLAFMRQLSRHNKVMMVGDGVNDQLAMKKASVSVAISGGAGASLESCDIYFSKPNISSILELLRASSKVRRNVCVNFSWVLIYNIIGISLVLEGHIPPILCAVIMPLSSLTVILTASLTQYFSKEP